MFKRRNRPINNAVKNSLTNLNRLSSILYTPITSTSIPCVILAVFKEEKSSEEESGCGDGFKIDSYNSSFTVTANINSGVNIKKENYFKFIKKSIIIL